MAQLSDHELIERARRARGEAELLRPRPAALRFFRGRTPTPRGERRIEPGALPWRDPDDELRRVLVPVR